jgi:hypothetical protein
VTFTVGRALLAGFGALLVVVAVFDASWIPLLLLVAVIVVGVPYALIALARGQSEWYDRESRRRRR